MSSCVLLILVFLPILMGLVAYFVGKKNESVRDIIAIVTSIVEVLLMVYVVIKYPITNTLIGMEFKADGFRSIFALIATFIWMCTIIFSKEYMHHYEKKNRYYLFYLITLGATVGVFLSSSLWTTFMFFEMMSLTSFVLVIHDERKESLSAGNTYLSIAIISGMILLMGMFILQVELKTLRFDEIYALCKDGINPKVYAAGICLLLGFGAKAGMFPLHTWLPKSYQVAPAPATALLSGILSKAGVFGIIIVVNYIFPSVKSFAIILLILALITMLLGAVLAVFSINFKRTLACSSMSQIGFILTGLSMMIFLQSHNAIAFEGSFLHMVNHSLIKLSLFMIAGVIYMNIHKLNLNEIKGFGRNKHFIKICFAVAMLGIMGIPLFNGYISKTLIHEAIVEYAHLLTGSELFWIKAAEYVFLFSGGLTIAYMLKIFICVFFEKNNDENLQKEYDSKKKHMKWYSYLVIGLASFILPFLGFLPSLTSNNLATLVADFFNVDAHHLHFPDYFAWVNLKGAVISLAIGLFVYFVIIRLWLVKKNENGQKEYIERFKSLGLALNKIKKAIVKAVVLAILFIFRSLCDFVDVMIYLTRKFILREYKYEFNGSPLFYKIGEYIDRIKKTDDHYFALKFNERHLIVKDVRDTLNATFAFDFLMACIGIVVILIIVLF